MPVTRASTCVGCLLLVLQASVQAADCAGTGVRLNEMASADQQVRHAWNALQADAGASKAQKDALLDRWRAIDGGNLAELKTLLAACGWPANARDSHSAWLLAQHADAEPAFQRHARTLLAKSVQAGIGAGRDLAYLSDRIAANEGRPQEYGTQFVQADRCTLTMSPVDDRALVNQRRLAVGLQTMEDYEAEGRRRFIAADCPVPVKP